jgi:GNAT superfamily N-acetyltransferase
LLPEFQGLGCGRFVLSRIITTARAQRLPVRLEALKGSPANDFYLHFGFVKIGESEFDHIYEYRIE